MSKKWWEKNLVVTSPPHASIIQCPFRSNSVSSSTFFPHHFCPVSPSPVLPSLGVSFLHFSDSHTFVLPRGNLRDERPCCETSNFHPCTFLSSFNYRCMHIAYGRQKFWRRKAKVFFLSFHFSHMLGGTQTRKES